MVMAVETLEDPQLPLPVATLWSKSGAFAHEKG